MMDNQIHGHKQMEGKVEDTNIVRVKRFKLEPMEIDEAIMQMNLLDHHFFVFNNVETNMVNVLYRRRDGNYGVIESAR